MRPDLKPGESATITRVPATNAELLRYLATLQLVPGGDVTVEGAAPFDGPLTLRTEAGTHAVSRELAALIAVG